MVYSFLVQITTMCMRLFVVIVCVRGGGGLSRRLTYWSDTLNASQFVQSKVQDGYKIPFRSIPETCFSASNKSARDHPDFVSEAIGKLLKGRSIY